MSSVRGGGSLMSVSVGVGCGRRTDLGDGCDGEAETAGLSGLVGESGELAIYCSEGV